MGFTGVEGDVGHGVGEVAEEGAFFVFLDELDGAFGIDLSEFGLIGVELFDFVAFEQGDVNPFGWNHVVGVGEA